MNTLRTEPTLERRQGGSVSQTILNLHNHTPFSDGAYTIDEICEAHLDQRDFRVEGVGISDHLFATPSSRDITNEREFERYFVAEARSYVQQVHAARERWAGKLKIYCGAEINWPKNKNMLHLIRESLDGIDYVLVEALDWAGLTQLANQARRFPCPVGLSMTDVSVQFPTTSHDQVVRTLANARIFYELNVTMLPLEEHDAWFNVLPKHRVYVTIGSDTHDDLSCLRGLRKVYDYAIKRGLGEKLLVPAPAREKAQKALSA